MKKLLLILSVGLSSCTGYISQGDRVISIDYYKDYECKYGVRGEVRASFYAPCGLYEIGDSVKFYKP